METHIPFNGREVHPYDPSAKSGYIDVFTGVMQEDTIIDMRNRAVFDQDSLNYSPIADSATGVLFPGAVEAKTITETEIRVRPTTFKGKNQLDLSDKDADQHFNRRIHPNAWNNSDRVWYKNKEGVAFHGFNNPNVFNAYTDIIATHNVQNLDNAQMASAMREMQTGNFNHDKYLQHLGSLMKSDAVPAPSSANIDEVIQSDGLGINSDPRLMEKIASDYETDFARASRQRVADVVADPRFVSSAPGMQYQAEQHAYAAQQESQFSKLSNFGGFGSSYTRPEKFRTG